MDDNRLRVIMESIESSRSRMMDQLTVEHGLTVGDIIEMTDAIIQAKEWVRQNEERKDLSGGVWTSYPHDQNQLKKALFYELRDRP